MSEHVVLHTATGGAADLAALMRATHSAAPVLHATDQALRVIVRCLSEGPLQVISGAESAWQVNARGAAILAGVEKWRLGRCYCDTYVLGLDVGMLLQGGLRASSDQT